MDFFFSTFPGKNKLTVPKYSNVCDALCHTRINKKMGVCPSEEGGDLTPILPDSYRPNTSPSSERVIMEYGKSNFVVSSGCPVENRLVQRYLSLLVKKNEFLKF